MSKKQKLYWVKLLNHNDGYLYKWTTRNGGTKYDVGNSHHYKDFEGTLYCAQQHFTIDEIKAIDVRYLQFKIEVDESLLT